jgi:hypothetical protein
LPLLNPLYRIVLLAACLLCGCVQPPAQTPSSGTGVPNTTQVWETLAPGLERRIYRPHGDNFLTEILVLRVDPALYTFRVRYHPGQPLNVRGWRDAIPGVTAFVNANFFDENHQVLGLLVSDGIAYGAPYNGYGGMFQVQDGQPRVRSNIIEPYAGESLEQVAQGFPVLVANGAAAYSNVNRDSLARRTVVAQDSSGRILLMVTPLVGMTLVELSNYLLTTDLGIVNAVNLDGGGSTMLYVSAGAGYMLSSFDPVPAVLAVYSR